MNLFDAFKSNKNLIMKTDFLSIYSVNFNDEIYTIIIPLKRANKHTIIHFRDNTIFWEQIPIFPRAAGRPYGDKIPIYKFNDRKVANTLFVVKGVPLGDEGLDNGIFRSTKKYDKNFVNCMTYKKFKRM